MQQKKQKVKRSKSKSKPKPEKSKSVPNPSSPSPKKDKNILLSYITYKNSNKITRDSLRNGRRIFNNKTELAEYDQNDPEFNKNFIEFRQLFFEDLLLTELKSNASMICFIYEFIYIHFNIFIFIG